VTCRGAACDFVVEVCGDVVLQEFPEIFDDQLGGTCVLVLLEPLVDTDDIHELVGQVVFRPLPVLKDNRWPHGNRRDGKNGKDRPLGTGNIGIDTERDEILVRDLFHPCAYVGRGKLVLHLFAVLDHDFGEGSRLLEVDLELLFAAVGADAFLLDILFREQVTGLVVFSSNDFLDLLRAQEHPATGAAGDTEELPDQAGIADMDDRLGEFDVTEMAGTFARFLVAGLAPETGVDDTEI